MNGSKSFWQSKTIWGSLTAIVASILAGSGKFDYDSSVLLVNQIIAAAGSLYAIYGRVVADSKLK